MPSTDTTETARVELAEAERAARTGALLVSEAERGVLAISGSERVSWLNGVVTCDVRQAGNDRAVLGLLLTKPGKIQTDFYLLADGDRLLLVTAPGTTEATRSGLEHLVVMEDVELTDVSQELGALFLHGPRALELAAAEARRVGGVASGLDLTGLGGAVLLTPKAEFRGTVDELSAAGARVAEGGDWPLVRIASGVGAFGIDYGSGDNPHEAGLERRAVAWDKGCYLGQEAVFMQDARGKVKRRLVVLAVAGGQPVSPGATIERETGERVGSVTSSAVRPPAGPVFALGKVEAPAYDPGTTLVIGGVPARVVARAFGAASSDAAKPGQTV